MPWTAAECCSTAAFLGEDVCGSSASASELGQPGPTGETDPLTGLVSQVSELHG